MLLNRLVSVAVVVAILFNPVASAAPAFATEEEYPTVEQLSAVVEDFREVTSQEETTFVPLAEDSDELAAFISSLAPGLCVDINNPWVYATSTVVGVRYPITGAVVGSNYQVMFDPQTEEVLHDYSLLADSTPQGVHAAVTLDGVPIYDGLPTGLRSQLSCVNECLSNQGLPAYLIGLIGLGCGAVCVGTALLGCAACITGVASAYGFTIGYCMGRCGF